MRWLVALALLAACAAETPIALPGAVTTIADGREIAVVGYLVDDGSVVRVCEGLAESYPPQCAGERAEIIALDTASFDGISSAGEVRWTDFPIELRGLTESGRLRYVRHVALSR